MGYVRISKDNCFSVYEYEKNLNEKLGLFFRIGQTVFVKNREEKITGIISVSDYQKCSGNENYQVNKEFKKILFHKGYMEEVRNFFEGTNYQSLPVLYENGELAECFVRTKTAYSMELCKEPWVNIANRHLAELVRKKGYKRIKISIVNSQSEEIYRYFKHYEFLYETVEKVLWYDILKMGEADIIITNYKTEIDSDLPFYSFHSLRIELEYRLLLHNCKKNKTAFYVISIPTSRNVWNITEEEQFRISKGIHWSKYFQKKEWYSELLEQVLGRIKDRDEFIDSCMDLPPIVIKDRLCYQREHTGKYVNVVGGNRLTEGTPEHGKKHIYLSGNSFVFGPLVDDGHTAASILQKMLLRQGKSEYRVVNEGMRGVSVYESLKRLNQDYFLEGGGRYHCVVYQLRKFFPGTGRRCKKVHFG